MDKKDKKEKKEKTEKHHSSDKKEKKDKKEKNEKLEEKHEKEPKKQKDKINKDIENVLEDNAIKVNKKRNDLPMKTVRFADDNKISALPPKSSPTQTAVKRKDADELFKEV